LNRQGTKNAKGFCSNRVHQPIERWLVLRFEQRAHAIELKKNCVKIPSASLCELGGDILVLLFDQSGRAVAGGAAEI
jgi:hypothetical protein